MKYKVAVVVYAALPEVNAYSEEFTVEAEDTTRAVDSGSDYACWFLNALAAEGKVSLDDECLQVAADADPEGDYDPLVFGVAIQKFHDAIEVKYQRAISKETLVKQLIDSLTVVVQ